MSNGLHCPVLGFPSISFLPAGPSFLQRTQIIILVDTFQRKIDYLRILITDNCNLKCKYCSPPFSGRMHLHRKEILSYEEITFLAEAAVAAGICRIRLTGGEPLIRKGVVAQQAVHLFLSCPRIRTRRNESLYRCRLDKNEMVWRGDSVLRCGSATTER